MRKIDKFDYSKITDLVEVFRLWYSVAQRRIKDRICELATEESGHEFELELTAHRLMCLGLWFGEIHNGDYTHIGSFVDLVAKYVNLA